MMDELKLIIEAIAGLPTITVWVLFGYLVYKLAVVGSVYGLIRFAVEKLHDAYVRGKRQELVVMLDGLEFDKATTKTELLKQLRRLQFIGKPNEYRSNSIHEAYGVTLLRETIDKLYEENEVKK